MPFPTAAADVEVLVRSLVAAKALTVAGVGHVFDGPIYVAGKTEYAAALGITNPDGIEVRYLSIQWLGWENTDRGCDANPTYYILYSLRVGQEFVPVRTGGGSSEKDFTAQCWNLRDAFRLAPTLGIPERLYCELLEPGEEVALQDDPHTGAFCHTVEFLLKVEVTPLD